MGNCGLRNVLMCISVALSVILVSFLSSGKTAANNLLLERARFFAGNEMPDSALFYADSLLHTAQIVQDTPLLIRCYGIKGRANVSLHQYKEATELYFRALSYCKSPKEDKQIAFIYGEIGYIYNCEGNFKDAEFNYEKELDVRKRIGQDKESANALINVAAMARHQQHFSKALNALNELASLIQHPHDTVIDGYYYANRGVLMHVTGKLDSAAQYYNCAAAIWKKLKRNGEWGRAVFNLGQNEAERKNYAGAIKYYNLCIAEIEHFGLEREKAEVHRAMADAYSRLGNFRDAYVHLSIAETLADSLRSKEFNKYTVLIDKRFQAEHNKNLIAQQQLQLEEAALNARQLQSRLLTIIVLLIVAMVFIGWIWARQRFRHKLKEGVMTVRNQFFENIAHEIKTPLSMIQAPLLLLQQQNLPPQYVKNIDTALKNTHRLSGLLDQMLSASRIDSGSFSVSLKADSILSFLTELNTFWKEEAALKKISWTADLDVDNELMMLDSDALGKVCNNLVSNALKYTPQGGSAGVAAKTGQEAGKQILEIAVWDSGNGIPKKEHEKVFERFYRYDVRNNDGQGGIGIGLSLVKSLVAELGGTVSVISNPGAGSVFTVKLPVAKAVPSADVHVPTIVKTVLVADDNDDVQDFIRTLLQNEGYKVITAKNGMEALNHITEEIPDLMITDLMMPEMDGMELIRNIKSRTHTAAIPILVLSARTAADVRVQAAEDGAVVYLSKPFVPAELIAAVSNILSIAQNETPPSQQDTVTADNPEDPFWAKCSEFIARHITDNSFGVEKLAALLNMSRSNFHRKTKQACGLTPIELIKNKRLEIALEMLKNKEGNITEIAYKSGFTSQSYFTKCFTEHFGYPPSFVLK
jgi:two-component system, sensor histidine kinase ChiS